MGIEVGGFFGLILLGVFKQTTPYLDFRYVNIASAPEVSKGSVGQLSV